MYLLDTNVVSELRRPKPHGAVVAWLNDVSASEIYISAVTLGELQAGVEITREHDPDLANAIEQWIDQVASADNVLPMDGAAFRMWARLMHRKPDDLLEDAMIAATAIIHGLVVATRNVRDFRHFDVRTVDPFATPRTAP